MYFYTAVYLEQKTFRELKSIARDMALVPLGDRRCRQNWLDVIVGSPLPLLKLLEVSPVVEVEPVVKPIEVQCLEAIKIEIQESSIESKFGRIIYSKPIVKPIAPVVENSPAVAEGDRSLPLVEYAAQNSPAVAEGDRSLPLVEYAAQTSPGVVELVAEAIGEVQEPLPEISPAEVELFAQAIEVQVQEPIEVQVQEPIEVQIQELIEVDQVQEPIEIQVQEPIESKLEPAVFQALTFSDALEICRLVSEALPAKTLQKLQMLRLKVLDLTARPGADCFHGHSKHKSSWINEIRSELTYLLEIRAIAFAPPLGLGRHISPGCLKRFWEIPTPPDVEPVQDAIEVQAQEAIEVQAIGPIEIQAIEPIAPAAETSPGVSEGDRPLVLTKDAAETFPGVSFDVAEFQQTHAAEIESYFNSVEGDRLPNRDDNARDRLENEPRMSQSAIVQAAKNLLDAEADQNPILTNITFSPGFLAHYFPPRSENIHYQTDADGQLSLLDFEVESVDEPPDPDDFEFLNAFREAIALWDATHPELIEIGLHSFSEWALCPDDWYEPDTLLEPSEVLELSLTTESSSTCKFLIPVFDAWCDRTNGNSDEPPTAGVGARLLKPKLPSFPLMGIFAGDRVAEWKNFFGFVGNRVAERKNFSGFVGNPIAERKNFSGFMFSAAGDCTNGNFDEPLTAGVGARLSKLKSSSFPLMAIVVGDCSNIKKFARSSTLFSGRAPPGGDV